MNRVFLFDWGDTLMRDDPTQTGPMWQWPHVSALPGALNVLHYADTLEDAANQKFVAEYRARYKEYPSCYAEYQKDRLKESEDL